MNSESGNPCVPQGVEFLLHPRHAFGRVILPDQLVILRPGAGAVIGAADERGAVGRAAIHPRALDDAALAMHKAEFRIRHQANLEQTAILAGGHQQVMQDVQALLRRHPMHIDQVRKVPGVPGQPQ